MQQEVKNEIEEKIDKEFEGLYIFSPSITKKRTIDKKTYIIRSYFAGKKDFEETIKRLAVKQAYKK